ncbi:hypothetical protein BRC83_07575 [Halobacteriales archaeon QS_1_68_17]|nr:MAG: hypothetical protein BRC83_07575 [Halobacteriales archaeon QS_1_68_17]
MSDPGRDDREADLARLAGELARALGELQRELEPRGPGGLPRPPTPRELLRFTDRVAIPAVILLLETNIRALRLLQRAIRLSEGRDDTRGEVQRRAEAVSAATLERLDGTLSDLQAALEGQPTDDRARSLLAEARALRAEIDGEIRSAGREESEAKDGGADPSGDDTDADTAAVDGDEVDVESELRSIKSELDGDGDGDGDDRDDN